MNTKQKDEENKTEELLTRKEIPDSPFVVIGSEQGYFGAMGKYRVTEFQETEEAAQEKCTEMTWNNIINTVLLLIDHNEVIKTKGSNQELKVKK